MSNKSEAPSDIVDEHAATEEATDRKRFKADASETDQDIADFVAWCDRVHIWMDTSKVRLSKHATRHNIGMCAVDAIPADHVLARIPRLAILDPTTSTLKTLIQTSLLLHRMSSIDYLIRI